LIGVADDGSVHGLESDYATLRNAGHDDRDVFQSHLANITVASMGAAATTNVRPTVHHVDGLDLWRVHVDPCGFPVDANVVHDKNGQHVKSTEFYVRVPTAPSRSTMQRSRSTSNSGGAERACRSIVDVRARTKRRRGPSMSKQELVVHSPGNGTHDNQVPKQPEGTPLGASSEEMSIGTTSSSLSGVTKQKTSVTIDREKIDEVRRFTGAGSTSAAIDVAVTEFIRLARAHRDVAAYTRVPPAADEVAIAHVRPDWSDLADETDWDSLYGGGAE